MGPRGEWILHLKVLKLRDWILGYPKGSAFPLLIVPTKLSWQPASLFRWAVSLLLKLFGSGVSGCGFSECFPSWLLERWLGRGILSAEAGSCLDAHRGTVGRMPWP